VRYIIPTRDGELPFGAGKKAWLEEHGIKVMVADEPAIDNCLDKLAFFSRCRELGIPAIATAADIENIVAESYVVKERYGSGARKIGLRLSRQDAVRFARDLAAPIFQQFVDGREYSVDAYVDLQGKVKGIVCRTRDVIVDGEAQVTTTVADGKLSANCAAYIEKLDLYAIHSSTNHRPSGKEWLIELNPRFGGALPSASPPAGQLFLVLPRSCRPIAGRPPVYAQNR
jgi:carbamoyl-phosphate synthase large subunit